jgi:hypothetical protein
MSMHRQEQEDVTEWRRLQLVQSGFPLPVAAKLAADPRYDVHRLVSMVQRGCSPKLAARILAPPERGSAA